MPTLLHSDEVHLWTLSTGELLDAPRITHYRRLLSEAELATCDRFVFERHQHQYLVSHALVRLALSQYADVEPAAWQFVENAHGKPDVAPGASAPPLKFNLTHTNGLVACAVCLEAHVGVDAEYVERRTELEIARRFFSSSEVEHLARVSPERKRDVFFDFWTLKEAYIKARGLGLSLPLSDFTMCLASGADPTISFTERIDDDPGRWRFWQFSPDDQHRIAICIERLRDQEWKLVQRAGSELGF